MVFSSCFAAPVKAGLSLNKFTELTKGISRDFLKLLKYFNKTTISTSDVRSSGFNPEKKQFKKKFFF